jgi:hypothetical protein
MRGSYPSMRSNLPRGRWHYPIIGSPPEGEGDSDTLTFRTKPAFLEIQLEKLLLLLYTKKHIQSSDLGSGELEV